MSAVGAGAGAGLAGGGRLRVLFVDDESRLLDGLQRMLRPLRGEWDMRFVDSGEAALAELARATVDVVVSDLRMPRMSGAELLLRVMREHPATLRVILSGQADRELVHKTIGPTHQYLAKPCAAGELFRVIERADRLRRLLASDRLRALAARLDHLPSLPALYLDLVALLQNPHATIADFGALVATDIGMTAKLLQLVNSAFFGMRRQVADATEAVRILGVETLQSLVLLAAVFDQLDARLLADFRLEALWQHSLAVSTLARRIAAAEGLDRTTCEEAYMAAMLHDVGRVVLAVGMPGEYLRVAAAAQARGVPLARCETELLGGSHAEVGAYLLGMWGLGEGIVEAVAYHHAPRDCAAQGFGAASAAHVADALHHGVVGALDCGSLEARHLHELGLVDRVPAWIRLAAPAPGGRT